MKSKLKILVFNRYYLPGYRAGGPIRTLANMVERLGDDLQFYLVTLDRDSGDHAPYPNIGHERWQQVGKGKVHYLAPGVMTARYARRLVDEINPDIIYLNGFFDPFFTQKVLIAKRLGWLEERPVVLAPRGEFSPGALALKSFKKNAYLFASRLMRIYHGITFQASSEHERQDILRSLPFVPPESISIAMNLAPDLTKPMRVKKGQMNDMALRLCFLSRISPMKNLDFALSCLKDVKEEVVFTIYGPKEVLAYWAQCENIIETLPDNVSVVYAGEVEHHRVVEVLSEHDLFFFPTRGENYGHVIHEALSAGLPVLISDQTPWLDLEEHHVGWAYSLKSPELFTAAIDKVALSSSEDRDLMRQRAHAYALDKSGDAAVLQANRELFFASHMAAFK